MYISIEAKRILKESENGFVSFVLTCCNLGDAQNINRPNGKKGLMRSGLATSTHNWAMLSRL